MWALRVDTSNEQSYAIWSPSVLLSVGLRAVCNAGGDFRERDGAVVGEAGGERLLLHEVGQYARIGGKTGESNTVVRINWDDLLLVGRELLCVPL